MARPLLKRNSSLKARGRSVPWGILLDLIEGINKLVRLGLVDDKAVVSGHHVSTMGPRMDALTQRLAGG
jgi:hypothetical protein